MNELIRPPLDQQVTFLYTSDLSRTAEFYENILGLPLVLDQGSCRIYQVQGAAFLGFCQHMDAPPGPEGVILTLVSQEVDGWAGYLQAQGVALEKPPTLYTRFNIYHCFLRDPNGYLIEIQRFLDPAWPQPASASQGGK
jgi:catechol 2,3-dioxygenase-like lactoylglutathione lyase family enzyme